MASLGPVGNSPAIRPIATFDLTRRCPLRCWHCYFFSAPPKQPDLDDATFLEQARALRDRHGIRSGFWVGGEPLLRLRLLRQALRLFHRNAVVTSGMVPIPPDLDAGISVSIDGLQPLHDRLRGTGTFVRIQKNLRTRSRDSFAILMTLTSVTLDAIDQIPALVEQTRARGVLVGFHVGRKGDPFRVDGAERDDAVDRLLAGKKSWPGVILNSSSALDLFRTSRQAPAAWTCIYHDRAMAFDTQLQPKTPCTFGANAGCDSCGCPVVMAQRARDHGDMESDTLLRSVFPRVS